MLTVGTYLSDRYEIINRIGAGGMSDVYKAMDHILGRFVAIKVLKMEFSDDRTFVSKFRTEAQSAAGLEHPNIVNIYDVGSEEGLHYIVMEYVEGITLKTYIEKKIQLSFKEAISIAIQVARGIEVAHNKNIVHRDIKPQNIIISTEGKVKVTDFGIARAASANTISSDVMGSVHYASPEQARNGFVDNRSDIYSLGVVMYEMVTGRVPFDGETTVAVALQHLQDAFPDPLVYAPELPVSMEKIILKCTQKTPDKRYQSMEELLADLRKALVNPNEDFVVIPDLMDAGKTKIMSQEDLQQIKSSTGVVADSPSDEAEDKDDEKTTKMAKPERRISLFGGLEDEEEEEDEEDDDDEEGGLNPKMDRIVTIVGIIVAVIIVIVIFFFVLSLFGTFKSNKKPKETEAPTQTVTETLGAQSTEKVDETVEMIDLVGMDQKEASQALERMGISVFVKTQESDKRPGTILSQDINEGQKVKRGSTVTVVVAEAEEMVEVPSVLSAEESDAVKALEALRLEIERSYEYSDTIPSGQVVSQNPSAGSKVEPGSKVSLVISQGIESVKVPVVKGMSSSDAQSSLAKEGLQVKIASEYSDNVPEGTVISQNPDAGTTLSKYSEVQITVSKGKKPEDQVFYKYTLKIDFDTVFNKDNLAPGESIDHVEVRFYDKDGDIYKSTNAENGYNAVASERAQTTGTVEYKIYIKQEDGTVKANPIEVLNQVSFEAYTKQ